ncbi:MAG: hypothetical protein PHR14_01510 [Oscillospiraceae bacterium]|nr:hypothetical protein [Oscillospiraceae bacterium]
MESAETGGYGMRRKRADNGIRRNGRIWNPQKRADMESDENGRIWNPTKTGGYGIRPYGFLLFPRLILYIYEEDIGIKRVNR